MRVLEDELVLTRVCLGVSMLAFAILAFAGCQHSAGSHDHSHSSSGETAAASASVTASGGSSALSPAVTVVTVGESEPSPKKIDAPAVPKTRPTAPASVTELGATDTLKVRRFVVTEKIEEREPQLATPLNLGGGPIYAFVELENSGDDPQQIEITFEHESGHTVGHVQLSIPGDVARWRTWGRTANIRKTGRWRAIVHDAAGEELGSTEFHVGEASS